MLAGGKSATKYLSKQVGAANEGGMRPHCVKCLLRYREAVERLKPCAASHAQHANGKPTTRRLHADRVPTACLLIVLRLVVHCVYALDLRDERGRPGVRGRV